MKWDGVPPPLIQCVLNQRNEKRSNLCNTELNRIWYPIQTNIHSLNQAYRSSRPILRIMWGAVFAFAGGVGIGIVTSGLSPLIELAFGYTTDITLLELANLDRPILKRLMIEVPGTYHHSMVVGTMVEAASSEIGANPLLAKVCGYYHDIGKIKKPLYFVENQEDGINRHDKLAPSMSSLILISHVKDGMDN